MVEEFTIYSYSAGEESKLCVVTKVDTTKDCVHISVMFDTGRVQVYSCLRDDEDGEPEKLLMEELCGSKVAKASTLLDAFEIIFRNGKNLLQEI